MNRARRHKEEFMNTTRHTTEPVQGFLATAQEVAFQPQAFFARLPRRGDYAGPLLLPRLH